MSLEIREGTVSDDQLCGTIMSAALKREDIPRSFLKNNGLILPLRNNLRIVAYYDNKPAGFCDYVISKGHINYLFVEPLFQAVGVGSNLLKNVQGRIKNSITVNVLCRNEQAILWYLNRGFIVKNLWMEQFNGKPTAWLKLNRKPF